MPMDICKECGKCVYEMEKMIVNQGIIHKCCFKCNHCKRPLNFNIYATMNGVLYCKPHYLEIFKSRGKYENNVDALNILLSSKEDLQNDQVAEIPNIVNTKRIFEIGDNYNSNIPDLVQTVKFDRLTSFHDEHILTPNCSGIFENDPIINENMARESLINISHELPEDGTTKSLVAKWRDIEVVGDGKIDSLLPGQVNNKSISRSNSSGRQNEVQNLVNEMSIVSIDSTPPVDITKNLRSIFQEKKEEIIKSPQIKQFKWSVKETLPINYPGLLINSPKSPNNSIN